MGVCMSSSSQLLIYPRLTTLTVDTDRHSTALCIRKESHPVEILYVV